MDNKAAAIIFDNGLSTKQVTIGRLVSHYLEPDNNFCDPPASFTNAAQITTLKDYGSKLTISKAPTKKISLKLTELFGVSHERASTASLQIKTKVAVKKTLSDYSTAFKCLIEKSQEGDSSVLSWIQDKINKRAHFVYFVVGIHSVKDAELSVVDSADKSNGVDLGVPVTDIVTHGASSIFDTNALDVMLSLSFSKSDAAGNSFKIAGERVVAVQYCAISLRSWFRSRSPDELEAEPTGKTWKWFVGPNSRVTDNRAVEAKPDHGVTGESVKGLDSGQSDDKIEVDSAWVGDLELVF